MPGVPQRLGWQEIRGTPGLSEEWSGESDPCARAARCFPGEFRHSLALRKRNSLRDRRADLWKLEQCGYHDGSGQTPVGQSLYPRVPDLRAQPTQNLTEVGSTGASDES